MNTSNDTNTNGAVNNVNVIKKSGKGRRSTIILSVIGALFIIAAVVLSIAALSLADFNFRKLGTGAAYVEKNMEWSDEICTVLIDDKNTAVVVVASSDGVTRLRYYEREKDNYEIELKDGALTVKKKTSRAVWDYMFQMDFAPTQNIYLEVANGTLDSLNIDTSNSQIKVSDLHIYGDLVAKTSNGSISLQNIDAELIKAKTINDPITAKKINADLDLKTTNGRVEIEDITAYDKVIVKTTNDPIAAKSVIANSVNLTTRNGKISVTNLDADDITLKTTNDGVSGTLVGRKSDYSIDSKTSNDSNNLENRGGGSRKLYVRTSNGKINITFGGEN